MNIKALELFTPQLDLQANFYSQILGLTILERSDTTVTFQIGHSILKLIHRAHFTPYHFAINIPANQEVEALKWLKQRVSILLYEQAEIQYFDFWDANAIYFYDEDKNIVELIARKRLNNNSNRPFDQNSMYEISEIGLPTLGVDKIYTILNEATGIPIYSGNLERFCAIGDDHGLFIVVDKNLKPEWFPTTDPTRASDFKITFEQGDQSYVFGYEQEVLKQH